MNSLGPALFQRCRNALRWQLRRALNLLSRCNHAPSQKSWRPTATNKVLVLFTGTHGDFMQALPTFQRLAAEYPGQVEAWIPARLWQDFASWLPGDWKGRGIESGWQLIPYIFHPAKRLYCNPVGVWRVRFDWAARFCARESFGFRHAEEKHRKAYTLTIPLDENRRDFARAFLELAEASGIKIHAPFPPPLPAGALEAHVGKGVLFHFGSRGMRQALGHFVFVDFCESILRRLEGVPIHLRYGPGDEKVAEEIRRRKSDWNPVMPTLVELSREVQTFRGAMLCFDSFFAHFCRYYGRPAWVLHRENVPFGYDSGDLHHQVVANPFKADLGLEDFWDELRPELRFERQELPTRDPEGEILP